MYLSGGADLRPNRVTRSSNGPRLADSRSWSRRLAARAASSLVSGAGSAWGGVGTAGGSSRLAHLSGGLRFDSSRASGNRRGSAIGGGLVEGNGCVEVSGVLVTWGGRIWVGVPPGVGVSSRLRSPKMFPSGSGRPGMEDRVLDWSPPLVLMTGRSWASQGVS